MEFELQPFVRRALRLDDVLENIAEWHHKKGILTHSTPHAQAEKALEECGELLGAASAYGVMRRFLNEEAAEQYREEIKDAVGDVVVCLQAVCGLVDLEFVECVEHAYAEIRDRRGEMRADGKFYKEQA